MTFKEGDKNKRQKSNLAEASIISSADTAALPQETMETIPPPETFASIDFVDNSLNSFISYNYPLQQSLGDALAPVYPAGATFNPDRFPVELDTVFNNHVSSFLAADTGFDRTAGAFSAQLDDNFPDAFPLSNTEFEASIQADDMPMEIEAIMELAMSNQVGSGSSFNQLLFEEVEEEQDDDDDLHDNMDSLNVNHSSKAFDASNEDEDMIQMDMNLGPQDDPRLFKNLPNFNPSSTKLSKMAKRRRKKRGILKAYPALPEHVSELMQAANMKYIEGQNSQAIEILREVIRERPDAHEAWLTLGMIYNSQNDINRMLQCKMMAAHLSKTNSDLWKSLGFTSKEMGHVEQALYCFKRAHRSDKNDLECVFEISLLSSELGDISFAQSGFEKILQVAPLERDCIKELAKIYLQKSKANEAIELFEKLVHADEHDPLPNGNDDDDGLDDLLGGGGGLDLLNQPKITSLKNQRMGYEELNMITELYFELSQYEKGLQTLHRGICKLHGRDPNQLSYESPIDYDSQLFDVPVELRVKIGVGLVMIDKPVESQIHLNNLYRLTNPAGAYPELYFDIGDYYMKKEQYKNALDIFEALVNSVEADESIEVKRKMAECHVLLGNIENTIMLYESILTVEKNDTKLQNKLVQLLEESGQKEKASNYQKKFLQSRALRKANRDQVREEEEEEENQQRTLFTHKEGKRVALKRKNEEEKIRKVEEEGRRNAETVQLYNRIMTLASSNQLDRNSTRSEYLLLGKRLILMFSKVDRIRLKAKESEGIVGIKRISYAEDGKGWNLHTGNNIHENSIFDEELCGVTLRQWYFLLIDIAFAHAKEGKYEDAFQTMKHALECQSFQSDERRKFELQMVLMAISVHCKEYEQAGYICRNFCFVGPFLISGLRLYSAIYTGGPRAIQGFSVSMNQKFLFRQVEKLQKMITSNPESVSPSTAAVLFGTYAIPLYLKALNYSPKDPVLYLSVGIAYMHRATQKTESRHGHLIKGFSFFSQYRELKGCDVESDYNLARAFHHFSLYHLAIPFYDKVLANPAGLFVRESAYNLCAIYMSIGSIHLAKQVMKKHWTIRC